MRHGTGVACQVADVGDGDTGLRRGAGGGMSAAKSGARLQQRGRGRRYYWRRNFRRPVLEIVDLRGLEDLCENENGN